MLSLIHLLAARSCHGGTLKRALLHNPEACRLLAYFGVTPTHLEDIAKGNTSRLRTATSTTLADYLLLSARLMAGGLDGTEAAMLRGQMEAPWRALTPKEHEAVRMVGALYDRLAKLQASAQDIRTQADFEYRLAEADEHVRVTEKRLLHASEFENEVLTLVGVEYRSEALDAIRALRGRLAAAEEDGARSIDCMNEVEDLLGIKAEGREDVLDAIRSLRRRAKFAEASAQELRQRLQAEHGDIRTQAAFEHQLAEADEHIRVVEGKLAAAKNTLKERWDKYLDYVERMARVRDLLHVNDNDDVPDAIHALLSRAESAEAALESGPIADLTLLTGRPVRVWRLTTTPDEWRYGIHIESYCDEHGATPHEALTRMLATVRQRETDKAKVTQPTPEATTPPEPIVLGPWREVPGAQGLWQRDVVKGTTALFMLWSDPNGWGSNLNRRGEETGQAGRDAADKWARESGYVLIDAEPGSFKGGLVPWDDSGDTSLCGPTADDFTIFVSKHNHDRYPGWHIYVNGNKLFKPYTPIAKGPQTGEEGKRYALAAARALGKTWSEK